MTEMNKYNTLNVLNYITNYLWTCYIYNYVGYRHLIYLCDDILYNLPDNYTWVNLLAHTLRSLTGSTYNSYQSKKIFYFFIIFIYLFVSIKVHLKDGKSYTCCAKTLHMTYIRRDKHKICANNFFLVFLLYIISVCPTVPYMTYMAFYTIYEK